MKINEVEAQVGITKKNIRFYEEQGLLSPRRNSENGYRDYGEAEVAILRQIKLMRKLGVPLEEIRRMQAGGTVADGMRRHLVTLEREKRNLQEASRLCELLRDREVPLSELDAGSVLAEMEQLEQAGAAFQFLPVNAYGIYAAAYEEKDFRTMQFLDWFVKEQGEEEDNANDLISKMELFGSDPKSLYMLNSELAGRVYSAPSLTL